MSKRSSATFDPELASLSLEEKTVTLNRLLAACLHLLLLRQDEIVSKEEIMRVCWSDRGIIVSEASVRQVLFQLRKALNDVGLDAGCLSNVQRKGYRLASGSIILVNKVAPVRDSITPKMTCTNDSEAKNFSPVHTTSTGIVRKMNRDKRQLRQRVLKSITLTLSLLISILVYCIRTGELVQPVHYELSAKLDDAIIYFQQDAEINTDVVLNVIRTLIERKFVFPSLNKYIYVNQTYSNSIVSLFICRAPLDQPDNRCYSLVAEDRK
jgi:cholera toxin transcriptional activator